MTAPANGDGDHGLVGSAQTDPAAFSRLYRRHYDAVFRHCCHRLFDRASAEDAASAVFLSALRNLHRFDGDERTFRNWLYRIATNEVNQHLRKAQRRRRLLEQVAERYARAAARNAGAAQVAEKLAAVEKSMLALKPQLQAVISLRYFDGIKPAEIAAILGTSAATVRSRLSRGLAALRKALAARGERACPEELPNVSH